MRVDHIGIAVGSAEESLQKYLMLFGNPGYEVELSADGTMKIVHIQFDNVAVELLEALDENCAVGKFLKTKGEGIHHIAFQVDDIQESISLAEREGMKILGDPRPGSNNMLITFIHPRDMNGVLTEFCKPMTGGEKS